MRGVRGRSPRPSAGRLLGQVPGHPVAPAAGGGTAEPGRRDPGIARRRIEEAGGAMTRRTLGLALLVGLLTAPLDIEGQETGRVYRVGILGNVPLSDAGSARLWGEFAQGLR